MNVYFENKSDETIVLNGGHGTWDNVWDGPKWSFFQLAPGATGADPLYFEAPGILEDIESVSVPTLITATVLGTLTMGTGLIVAAPSAIEADNAAQKLPTLASAEYAISRPGASENLINVTFYLTSTTNTPCRHRRVQGWPSSSYWPQAMVLAHEVRVDGLFHDGDGRGVCAILTPDQGTIAPGSWSPWVLSTGADPGGLPKITLAYDPAAWREAMVGTWHFELKGSGVALTLVDSSDGGVLMGEGTGSLFGGEAKVSVTYEDQKIHGMITGQNGIEIPFVGTPQGGRISATFSLGAAGGDLEAEMRKGS